MLELSTDAMTGTIKATASTVHSGLRLARTLVRIVLGLLMAALGAILSKSAAWSGSP